MKRVVSLILIMILLVSTMLTGCINGKNELVLEEEYNVSVKDHLDRKVTLEKKPMKIISADYVISSLLIALGRKDRVIAVEKQTENRKIYEMAAEEFLALPEITTKKSIDVETCATLNPDLVIAPISYKKSVSELEKAGIPVIAVDISSYDSFIKTIHMVARAISSETRGDVLVNRYKKIVAETSRDIPEQNKPRVYFAGDDSIYTASSDEMYQADIIKAAGGINVTENIEDPSWTTVTSIELNTWDPHFIITSQDVEYDREELLGDYNISGIDAITNNRIYKMPSAIEHWEYPTPSSMLGILWLRSRIYTKAFPMDDFVKTAKSFYKTFYDIDVDEEDLLK